ncbi:hypothetical protein HK44_029340 (plasmid) [Pseudomonas fluorescens HK44]|uniref:Uncharacterized protein n=1 Tax=Pseudomonas fluorescens HK44 TaxID=1042209 RepID=A0A010RPH5_PSEFL|nr:hypothetical protein [Pseudomonas fluorescens]EXF91024.1 hypothetical protein HK44_029340 [Pseudomonas fluorescens HK44]
MSSGLTEDDMRQALGLDVAPLSPSPSPQPTAVAATPKPRPPAKAKARTPKLRVTLCVSQEFEGETTLLTHEADTLSRFDAEQQARTLAKQAKYRYVELVAITPIE